MSMRPGTYTMMKMLLTVRAAMRSWKIVWRSMTTPIRPEPIFWGQGPRYFGVELEIDGAGESTSKVKELLKFSRRTQSQLNRWASRYGYKDQPQAILDHAKKGCHAGRYTCVNLTNEDTIEFRIFRGTLKYNTLIATLQLIDKICDVALFLSDEELKAMSWTTFVSGCQAPKLVQYLKERRLYVNEAVNTEEEV